MPVPAKESNPLPDTTVPQTQHAGAAQASNEGTGNPNTEAEHYTAAHDATMTDRPESPSSKTHANPETQAMLPFGTSPTSLPTSDQTAGPSDFCFDFEAPESVAQLTRGPSSTFVPATFLDYVDREDEDPNPESDSDIGGGGDEESQHEGQEEDDGRTA